MDYLYLIIGLGLLLLGANYLVNSSVAIAQRAKVSNFIIGLTIVGIGTSAPELLVSISSALSGHGDVAMGNVVGSNISNILLILGVTAALCPFTIEREQQLRDIPFCIFATLLMVMLVSDNIFPGINENSLSRIDGIFLLIVLFGYMCYVVIAKGKNPQEAMQEADEQAQTTLAARASWQLWAIALVSLASLIGGGQLFLNSAINLAHTWGMSEAVISITIIAIGTSLPELVTAVVAASKGNAQLALGDVLGSNVFNVLGIVGVSSTITPLTVVGVSMVDFAVLLTASIAVYLIIFTFGKHKFDRVEGIIFVLAYIAYTIYLLMK